MSARSERGGPARPTPRAWRGAAGVPGTLLLAAGAVTDELDDALGAVDRQPAQLQREQVEENGRNCRWPLLPCG